MQSVTLNPIGKVRVNEDGAFIELEPKYLPALQAIDGFSHLNILWWCSGFDDEAMRNVLETPKPYKNGPEIMGIFATRSPIRPNPVALTAVQVIDIDEKAGQIRVAYIDAEDDTPVLDIKPYQPSFDRVETPGLPAWCAHWPKSTETSGDFDWESEMNF